MIKGIGKQIVLLHNTESEIFEQAIFILRTGSKVPYPNMVKECERMINSYVFADRRKERKNGWKIAFFCLLAAFILLGVYVLLK